ncbi:MAG: hypothetical protein AMQ74_00683 [Candidatus Methanofastidiosum methylothiophilum]|uniref:Uncharacterized protein n=1 Tax=Candidatus Methanofastidiosum methylothiophilum TaxID=1705564 RepID=A0A150J5X3_9EURY|nr:MAG: hypothetical protein AMQ74_00683 [Candidatus Methanofastidiosum methylthiophilus]
MKLSQEEIDQFIRLYKSLLIYAKQKNKGFNKLSKEKRMYKDEWLNLRDILANNMTIIDEYINENPYNLKSEELNIIKQWKNGIYSNFFIIEYENEYTVMYDNQSGKSYAVMSLNDPISEFIEYIPSYVRTFLLPFKGKIVYDGLINTDNVIFVGSTLKSIMSMYKKSIAKYGLIKSFDEKINEHSDEELLKFYLKTKSNLDNYYDEIEDIIVKNPSLEYIFHKEIGRINSRKIKSKLKDNGVKGFFAILTDTVVASASNKSDLNKRIEEVVPNEKRNWIHIFNI